MFQINSMILTKMGWSDHSSPTFNSPKFDDNDLVRFYIRPGTIYIFIKELSSEEKQKSKKSYKFVIGKREIQFNSNMELLRLIIKNEACNEEYKRHFKLNKILR